MHASLRAQGKAYRFMGLFLEVPLDSQITLQEGCAMKNKTYPGLITIDNLKVLHKDMVIRIHGKDIWFDALVKSVGLTTLTYWLFDGNCITETFEDLGIIPYPIGVESPCYVTDRDAEIGCRTVFGG